jgi:hypothetical protein
MMDGVADQNRVTPLGEIEAFPLPGAFTGNRGRLHEGRRIVRFHAGDLWIVRAAERARMARATECSPMMPHWRDGVSRGMPG